MLQDLRVGIFILLELLCFVSRLGHWLTELVAADARHVDPVHQLLLGGCVILGSAEVVIGIFSGVTITFVWLVSLNVQIQDAFV